MKIKFNDLNSQYNLIKDSVFGKLENFFKSESFIDGIYVREFEKEFCKFTGRKYSIGVSNGTDGLKLAIQAIRKRGMNIVMIPANTFIADALAVIQQINQDEYSFEIKLIDCDDYYQMDTDILKKELNKVKKGENIIVIGVHMYGHTFDMETMVILKNEYGFSLIEDASQAHGAKSNIGMVGNIGDITVYSLYPGKNLGAFGDAGVITTDEESFYNDITSIRNYGSVNKYVYEKFGWNNRMDGIQAIFLSEKLKHLDEWNRDRQRVANIYKSKLSGMDKITLPMTAGYCKENVYHIFCIRIKKRELLQSFLSERGIPTIIHYPIPIGDTPIFKHLDNSMNYNTSTWSDEILSLPIHPFMSEEEIAYVCDNIKSFFENEN
jgi:dTDP-4-amino-4,6-dideoxygalactose transaminase